MEQQQTEQITENTVSPTLNTTTETNNSNFDLIKFELMSEFGSPNVAGWGNWGMKWPSDIIYSNNLIYISDYGNSRLLILDNSLDYNNVITLDSKPYSLALNNNKDLFIVCEGNIIYKYNLNTLQLIDAIKSNENYTLNIIDDITFDKDNNLYICNSDHKFDQEIIILNENYEFIRKFTIRTRNPNRILINNKNQIVITFRYEGIHVYDNLGNFISKVKVTAYDELELYGIINDQYDNYIVCDMFENRLLILDNEFKLKREFKKNLNNPKAIALNVENNQIYVVAYSGQCCKLFK